MARGDIADIQNWESKTAVAANIAVSTRVKIIDFDTNEPMRITYTPEVECWWETQGFLGYCSINDASWNYAYLELVLTPSDGNGNTVMRSIEMVHNTATFGHRGVRTMWKLAAGVPYECQAWFNPAAGTHNYLSCPEHQWLFGIAYEM